MAFLKNVCHRPSPACDPPCVSMPTTFRQKAVYKEVVGSGPLSTRKSQSISGRIKPAPAVVKLTTNGIPRSNLLLSKPHYEKSDTYIPLWYHLAISKEGSYTMKSENLRSFAIVFLLLAAGAPFFVADKNILLSIGSPLLWFVGFPLMLGIAAFIIAPRGTKFITPIGDSNKDDFKISSLDRSYLHKDLPGNIYHD